MTKTSKTTPNSGTKPKLIFFGNERLATGTTTSVPILRSLIKAGYPIACVVSSYERGVSRSGRGLEIEVAAQEYGIPLLLPDKLSDISDQLKNMCAEAAILVAYGKMVPQSIIDIFPRGIINIHPSALPMHRGPTPLESVILDGSKQTAVSVMQLAKAMDAGPVYAQEFVPLNGSETKQELADSLLSIGSELLLQNLPSILGGSAHPSPQNETKATYDALIQKNDGIVDWAKPASRLEREVRAYAEWPKSRATLAGREVVITSAHVTNQQGPTGNLFTDGKTLGVFCGKDALIIDALKPAGKNEMTASAFLAGYRHLLEQQL